MRAKIDAIDLKLMELLSENSRLTYKELAAKLKTTRQRISRRLEKLEKMGLIKKYTIVPDFDQLGYIYVVLGITVKPGTELDSVVEELKKERDIKVIEKALGSHNLVIHLLAPKDMKKLETRINEIAGKISGMDKLDITFITDIVKFETL
ncbi:Lrp/AsnC family transcriptional regulator [Thermococcus sp.]